MKRLKIAVLFGGCSPEYARVKYNKPEQLFDVVNSAFHQVVPS